MRRVPCWMLLAVVLVVAPRVARASSVDHVVIAEVQIGGASSRDEFVELYNPTTTAQSLDGWRLAKRTASGSETNLVTTFPALVIPAHRSLLIAHPEGVFAAVADQRYTTQESFASNNAVVLYGPLTNGTRAVVDLVGWGSATTVEGSAAPDVPNGSSLERAPRGSEGNGIDSDDNAADFSLIGTPTPQGLSAAERPALDGSDAGARGSSPSPTIVRIRINEFVPDPNTGAAEWVELVNIDSAPTSLAGWTLEEGSGTRTVLSETIGVGEQRFVAVRALKGQLNNDGDRIVLRTPSGTLVDAVTYGNWNDGDIADNAPTATNGAAVARIVDGGDTDNDRADFSRTDAPTPGAANVVSGVASTPAATLSASAPTSRLVLNELLPNPVDDDLTAEFIEIANLGDVSVSVEGWRLRDPRGIEHVIRASGGSVTIAAHGFLALPRSRTMLAIRNEGGQTVQLFVSGQDRAVATAEYHGAAAEGLAWARSDDGKWSWTTQPTSGQRNVLVAPNAAPFVVLDVSDAAFVGEVIVGDASDSEDPEGGAVTFAWDFGDPRTDADHAAIPRARYVYDTPGTYTITGVVTDPHGASTTATHRITIRARPGIALVTATPTATIDPHALRWSELLPNPVGDDGDEWIELENTTGTAVPLRGWFVVRGTATMQLPETMMVPAHRFVSLSRRTTHLPLRNAGDVLELRAPDGRVTDVVEYEEASEGMSFARPNDECRGRVATCSDAWAWTTTPTPGRANVIVEIADAPEQRGAPSRSRSGHPTGAARDVALGDLADLDLGTQVRVQGSVVAPVGVIGTQVFAIADAQAGTTVFVGAREIPSLQVGDVVVVTGEVRTANGERRLGITDPADVRVTRAGGVPPTSVTLRIADAGADRLGTLVTVSGEVLTVRGRAITLDDGSDEMRVLLPAAMTAAPPVMRRGDTMRASGILHHATSGYRILVRGADDLVVTPHVALPATPLATGAPPPPADRSLEMTLLGSGGSAVLAATAWRRRRILALAVGGVARVVRSFARRVGVG